MKPGEMHKKNSPQDTQQKKAMLRNLAGSGMGLSRED